MRLRQALGCLADAEIAVFRVSTQTVGFKVLVAIMADGDALFRTSALCSRHAACLGLEFASSRGFGGGSARRRFFLGGGAARGPRCRLLLAHRRSPFRCCGRTLAQIALRSWAKRERAHHDASGFQPPPWWARRDAPFAHPTES